MANRHRKQANHQQDIVWKSTELGIGRYRSDRHYPTCWIDPLKRSGFEKGKGALPRGSFSFRLAGLGCSGFPGEIQQIKRAQIFQ